MYIFKAAVVGAGTMGGEIAQVISFSGLPVVLKDIDQQALDAGLARARSIYQRRVDRGRMTESEMASKLDLITPTLSYDQFNDVDFVIEAVPESLDLKRRVFAELDQVTPPLAILASNTSSLSISEMAAATSRPQRVVGFHFFYPASVMKLIEVVAGQKTSEETVGDAMAFAESLRKIPVRVKECPGFLVNRVLMVAMVEVLRLQQETGASCEEIDAIVQGRGLAPLGPFTLADMLGLDVALEVGRVLEKAYGDRFALPETISGLVARGHLGTKTGRGFYVYTGSEDEEAGPPAGTAARGPGAGPQPPRGDATSLVPDHLVDRFSLAAIAEACRCLEEGIASAKDIDLAMRAGAGFPEGPLARADDMGLDVLLDKLERLHALHGDNYAPTATLRRLVSDGRLGKKVGRGFFEWV